MSNKKFELSMIIQAIDRVTEPAKKMTASIRKMTMAAEKDSKAAHDKVVGHAKGHAKHHAEEHEGLGGKLAESFAFLGEIGMAITGVTLGIEGLVEGYKKVTEASDEAQKSQVRMATLMGRVKGTTREQIKEVSELAEKLEGKTALNHKVFEAAAGQLAAFGMNARQIRAILPAFADFESAQKGVHATSEDAIAGAKLLGKAYSGNVGALRRAGIVFTAAQEAVLKHGSAYQRTAIMIKALEGKFAGLAARLANTEEGQAARLGNSWEKVLEKIGQSIQPLRDKIRGFFSGLLPKFEEFADRLPEIFKLVGENLNGSIKQMRAQFQIGFKGSDVGGFTKSFTSWLTPLLDISQRVQELGQSVMEFVSKLAGQAVRWVMTMWTKSQPGLKAFAEGFKPVIEAVTKLWKEVLKPFWDQVLAPLQEYLASVLVPFLVNILGPAFKYLMGQIAWQINLFTSFIGMLWKWTAKISTVVGNFFLGLWSRVTKAFGHFKNLLMNVWQDAWNAVFKWLSDKWGSFLSIFSSIAALFNIAQGAPGVGTGGGGGAKQAQPRAMDPNGRYAPANPGDYIKNPAKQAAYRAHIHITHEPGVKLRVVADELGMIKLGAHGLA